MLGASARYGIAVQLPSEPGQFPWATWWTNLTGSLLLGLLLAVVIERLPQAHRLRAFLATGVLGAFTTMSAYQVEAALLLEDGHLATGALYGVGSVAGGIGLAWGGVALGRRLRPDPDRVGRAA